MLAKRIEFVNNFDAVHRGIIGDMRAIDQDVNSHDSAAHQNQGIYSAFLHHYLDYARELGYTRVTSNHMVNNRRVLVAKLKAGFVASGMSLDERGGAMIWLTCHLRDELANTYRSAFSLESYD